MQLPNGLLANVKPPILTIQAIPTKNFRNKKRRPNDLRERERECVCVCVCVCLLSEYCRTAIISLVLVHLIKMLLANANVVHYLKDI